jgi:uncharacterized membrane protein YesL
MIYFGLLYIRLSRSHYLSRGFGGLTYLTRVFIDFFYWIFFFFILQHLVDYELGLMNYVGLLSMGLSRSYARVTCFVG